MRETVVHKLQNTEGEELLSFLNWYLLRRMAQKDIIQSSVLWLNFVLNPETVDSQNNRFPMLIQKYHHITIWLVYGVL